MLSHIPEAGLAGDDEWGFEQPEADRIYGELR